MVSVVVVRPFRHLDRNVYEGQSIEMDPIDAAVKAREGLVSLLHGGGTYQTRDLVAGAPVPAMTVESLDVPTPAEGPVAETPPKRRRGRPRKAL